MDIFIKWSKDTQSITIPILPASFEIEDSQSNTVVNIHNLGDINLKGKRSLYSLSFDSFFPGQAYEFEHGRHRDPYDYYVKKIKTLFERNETLHVIITETNINSYFTIESFKYGHSDKTNDVSYSLTFIEYRETTGRVKKPVNTKTVAWKKGDTWPKVTKKALGKSDTYKTQKKNNKSVIDKARKAYKKKHPKVKKIDDKVALIGYKVVIKP